MGSKAHKKQLHYSYYYYYYYDSSWYILAPVATSWHFQWARPCLQNTADDGHDSSWSYWTSIGTGHGVANLCWMCWNWNAYVVEPWKHMETTCRPSLTPPLARWGLLRRQRLRQTTQFWKSPLSGRLNLAWNWSTAAPPVERHMKKRPQKWLPHRTSKPCRLRWQTWSAGGHSCENHWINLDQIRVVVDFGTILKSTYINQQKPFRVCVGVCYRFIRCKWICSGMSHYFVTDVIIHLFQKILTDIP